jgi:hypothetical protein
MCNQPHPSSLEAEHVRNRWLGLPGLSDSIAHLNLAQAANEALLRRFPVLRHVELIRLTKLPENWRTLEDELWAIVEKEF